MLKSLENRVLLKSIVGGVDVASGAINLVLLTKCPNKTGTSFSTFEWLAFLDRFIICMIYKILQ